MDVLVTGGTGFIGRHLCEELIARGHGVTAMSRDPDDELVPAEVRTATGDVTEYETLPEVVAGHDAVVHLVALSPLFQPEGGEGRHEIVIVEGTRNIVRAMNATDVDRLVYQSGLGADPDGLTAHLQAKGRAEGIIRASDLDWTITRPSVVFGDGDEIVPFTKTLTTPYLTGLPGGGETMFQLIWVGDLVVILADIIEDERHIGETYELGGPAELSLADVTRAVHGAEGRPVRILPVPMGLARLGLTVAGWLPVIPFSREQYRGLHIDNRPEENAIQEFGFAPADLRSFEDYLADKE